MTKEEETQWEPLPEYGDHMTIEEFAQCVMQGLFIDYDGSGRFASATQMSNVALTPSTFAHEQRNGVVRDTRFTHVVWFNK